MALVQLLTCDMWHSQDAAITHHPDPLSGFKHAMAPHWRPDGAVSVITIITQLEHKWKFSASVHCKPCSNALDSDIQWINLLKGFWSFILVILPFKCLNILCLIILLFIALINEMLLKLRCRVVGPVWLKIFCVGLLCIFVSLQLACIFYIYIFSYKL